jgi:hypothetical protein
MVPKSWPRRRCDIPRPGAHRNNATGRIAIDEAASENTGTNSCTPSTRALCQACSERNNSSGDRSQESGDRASLALLPFVRSQESGAPNGVSAREDFRRTRIAFLRGRNSSRMQLPLQKPFLCLFVIFVTFRLIFIFATFSRIPEMVLQQWPRPPAPVTYSNVSLLPLLPSVSNLLLFSLYVSSVLLRPEGTR